MALRGFFVTFEGIEGVGKSTQQARAAEHLRGRGIDPLLTREPGGTALAEKLRALVLEPAHAPVDEMTELLIMFAARASHVASVIRPALRRGRWVLCDRFTDATEAYQGHGRGIPSARIRQLARLAHPRLTPDLTFVFDAPPEIAHARIDGRDGGRDRIESEGLEFFRRVRSGYLAIAAREPGRVRVLDATAPIDAIAARVAESLDVLAGRRAS